MTRTTMALTLSLATLAPLTAAAAPRAFRLVARTEQASYFSPNGRGVDVKRSEAYLARLAEVFGPAPEGWRLEYYRHTSTANVRTHSGATAVGITDLAAGRIDSIRPFHPHELVHAVAGRIGRCPAFFAEGLAVALTSEGHWGERKVDDISRDALASNVRLQAFLTSFTRQDPNLGYPLAGSFVAFLLDQHGIDPFVVFLQECESSTRGYETAFRRAYGRSVANATIAWRAALLSGQGAGWGWADSTTWPSSLRRAARADALSPETVRTSGNTTAGVAASPDLLLSVQP